MKPLILLALLLLVSLPVFALPVSSAEAQTTVQHWLQAINPESLVTIASCSEVSSPSDNAVTDWYLVRLNPSGYVLLAADDRIIPILGYSLSDPFGTGELPPNLTWFLDEYHTQIELVRSQPATTEHAGWMAMRRNDFSGWLPDRPVGPLLTTTWDQGWPYNSMCPSAAGGPGGHVYAGCMATSMGQIMKYWAYPQHGTGSHTYTSDYGVLSVNFETANYLYSSMPNSIWSANTQIGTLLYHLGVAVEMDYGVDGSGSQATAARSAFLNFFNYETTVSLVWKAGYNATTWDNMMKTDLDSQHPILYLGYDTQNGGHAWVCDGYQGTGNNYFHMNWGWSGVSNGYFYLNNLNPQGFAFNSEQGAVYRIQPPAAIAPPTGLTASVESNNVFLMWNCPISRALLGYKIYRNGSLITQIDDPLNTTYYDINLTAGTYSYYVTAVFSQGDSAPSNSATATILPPAVINYQDGFEAYPDFSTSFSPWFTFDNDNSQTKGFSDNTFPNEGNPLAFMVFNPSAVTPPLTDIQPRAGQKMAVCFSALNPPNNDWLISPKWNTGSIKQFHFWARTVDATNGPEQIKVGVSTTSPDPASMTIISGPNPVNVPSQWYEYQYTLTNYGMQNVFVGIQCVSNNTFMLLIDNVEMWSNYMDAEDENSSPAQELTLSVSPNPFRNQTRFSWQQKNASPVILRISDVKGRIVRTLDGTGTEFTWNGTGSDGKPLPSGVYFCQLADRQGHSAARKLLLLK